MSRTGNLQLVRSKSGYELILLLVFLPRIIVSLEELRNGKDANLNEPLIRSSTAVLTRPKNKSKL